MRALPTLALGAVILSACSTPDPRNRFREQFLPSPTNILTADIAQNRVAQEDGVLKALRDTAADEALVLAPGPINAKQWLSQQSVFPATRWSPHRVIMSCDGKTGVTTGAIRWGETDGFYTTVWQYQPRGRGGAEGEWEWTLSHGDGVETAIPEPDIVKTDVASCDSRPAVPPPIGPNTISGDGTLIVRWEAAESGSRFVQVQIWDGETFQTVLEDTVTAR